MINTYKVYLIRNRETNIVVYVGLTSQPLWKRLNQHLRKRGWIRDQVTIELVQEHLTIDEGVILEEMLIENYKTRSCGFNKAPQAKNGYSTLHSEDQKEIWSKKRKGRFAGDRATRNGKRNSLSQNEKIGKVNSKPVICVNDGQVYSSLRQAAKTLSLSESKVSLVCSGKRSHTKGYIFKYLIL